MPQEADDDLDPALYLPGTFGCHEALHMANVCAEMVDERLCEHPAVRARPEWVALAEAASSALHDLYQAIGAVHLQEPAQPTEPAHDARVQDAHEVIERGGRPAGPAFKL